MENQIIKKIKDFDAYYIMSIFIFYFMKEYSFQHNLEVISTTTFD